MTPNSKILSVALAAAVLGGSTVALVNHSKAPKTTESAPAEVATTTTTTQPASDNVTVPANNLATTQSQPSSDNLTATTPNAKDNQTVYRDGYTQGLRDARENQPVASSAVSQRSSSAPVRTVTRTRYVRSAPRYSNTAERNAYYDYSRPRQRSFWQKHRDKLTVAGGTLGGAMIGGLIGGKKGAAIGALSGGGGSAVYTYKIRKRDRHY